MNGQKVNNKFISMCVLFTQLYFIDARFTVTFRINIFRKMTRIFVLKDDEIVFNSFSFLFAFDFSRIFNQTSANAFS